MKINKPFTQNYYNICVYICRICYINMYVWTINNNLKQNKKMKKILFALLFIAMLSMCIAMLTKNIYLLGIAELVAIPTIAGLIKLNFKTK